MKLCLNHKRGRGFTATDLLILIALVVIQIAFVMPLLHRPHCSVRIHCASNLKQIGLAYRTWEDDNGSHYPQTLAGNATTFPAGVLAPVGTAGPPPGKFSATGWTGGGAFQYIYGVYQAMSNELNNPKVLVCPEDTRTPASDFNPNLNNSHLSYFVGLDADEKFPGMLLSGDRNLTTNNVQVGSGLLALNATNSVGWSDKMHHYAGNVGLADGSVMQVNSAGLQQLVQRSGTNIIRLAIP